MWSFLFSVRRLTRGAETSGLYRTPGTLSRIASFGINVCERGHRGTEDPVPTKMWWNIRVVNSCPDRTSFVTFYLGILTRLITKGSGGSVLLFLFRMQYSESLSISL